ncbi:hypothetical protein GCM10008967_00070 [Bacillus carboniphilus]|uniref:Helix-turn-helix domain-containing protein n=1 Tax=Bacillus carboniphilus TaxID=86663 RepID=A0ABN0VPV3_9BACI
MSIEETIRKIIQEENEKHYERIEQLLDQHGVQGAPPLLTVEEAAQILKMGKTSVYELTNRHDFPAIRDGRKVRISYSGLMNWINTQSTSKQAI